MKMRSWDTFWPSVGSPHPGGWVARPLTVFASPHTAVFAFSLVEPLLDPLLDLSWTSSWTPS